MPRLCGESHEMSVHVRGRRCQNGSERGYVAKNGNALWRLHAFNRADKTYTHRVVVQVARAVGPLFWQVQSKFGQEDAPGGHKTLESEKSIDLAEDTRVGKF